MTKAFLAVRDYLVAAKISNQGQTLIEFVISLGMVLTTLVSASYVLHAQWNRTRCAYRVFEATHNRLIGRPQKFLGDIQITEDTQGFQGVGRCGSAQEKVRLQKLESFQW